MGIPPPAAGDSPAKTAGVSLAIVLFSAAPAVAGAALGWLRTRTRARIVVLLADGTVARGRAVDGDLDGNATSLRLRGARVTGPDGETRVAEWLELSRGEVRMLRRGPAL